jgi:hypothetical protein
MRDCQEFLQPVGLRILPRALSSDKRNRASSKTVKSVTGVERSIPYRRLIVRSDIAEEKKRVAIFSQPVFQWRRRDTEPA